MRILLIEVQRKAAESVRQGIETERFDVIVAMSGKVSVK